MSTTKYWWSSLLALGGTLSLFPVMDSGIERAHSGHALSFQALSMRGN